MVSLSISIVFMDSHVHTHEVTCAYSCPCMCISLCLALLHGFVYVHIDVAFKSCALIEMGMNSICKFSMRMNSHMHLMVSTMPFFC